MVQEDEDAPQLEAAQEEDRQELDVFQKEEDTKQQTVKKDLIQEQEDKALKEGVNNAQPEEDA